MMGGHLRASVAALIAPDEPLASPPVSGADESAHATNAATATRASTCDDIRMIAAEYHIRWLGRKAATTRANGPDGSPVPTWWALSDSFAKSLEVATLVQRVWLFATSDCTGAYNNRLDRDKGRVLVLRHGADDS